MADDNDYGDLLWVDDDPTVLRALHDAFPGSAVAETGINALVLLRTRVVQGSPYRVMAADVVMPDMNGVELCQRARVISPRTRRALITGRFEIDAEAAVNAARASLLLRKPFDMDTVRAAIAELRQRTGDSAPKLQAVSEDVIKEAALAHQEACSELERCSVGAAASFDLPTGVIRRPR